MLVEDGVKEDGTKMNMTSATCGLSFDFSDFEVSLSVQLKRKLLKLRDKFMVIQSENEHLAGQQTLCFCIYQNTYK